MNNSNTNTAADLNRYAATWAYQTVRCSTRGCRNFAMVTFKGRPSCNTCAIPTDREALAAAVGGAK